MKRPFPKRTISSTFGRRIVPGTAFWHQHTGTDYAVPGGSTVRAIADGIVSDRRWHDQLGHVITIKHEKNRRSKYMHLRDAGIVKKGDRVTEGDPVGIVGNTGKASRGDHLHLETWQDGVCVDPETWFA